MMGVGRRMKKQGPPPDLGKVKTAGFPTNGVRDGNVRSRKRNASGEIKPYTPGVRSSQSNSDKMAKSNGRQHQNPLTISKKGVSKLTPQPGDRIDDELLNEEEDDEDDENDDDDAEDFFGIGDTEDEEPGVGVDDRTHNGLGDSYQDDSDGADNLEDDMLSLQSSVYDSDPLDGGARFSEDEESDAEEKLTAANIEGLSRKLDHEQEENMAEAQLELEEAALQTNMDGDNQHIFDQEGDGYADGSKNIAPDLQLLRSRISDNIRVLDNFATLSEKNRSRTDYTSQLLKDICLYYGYSHYLAEKFFNLFAPREAFAFFEANETPRPVVIRTNTLRTHRRQLAQALINRGVTLEPVGKWSKVGLQIFESQVPLGATPEYLAGHYILQAASSFLPVMALAPQEHERILDMAAAPGGKTTYIAALMKNTGCVFANDSNKARAKGLIGNIHRLGVKNTIVCNYDAREFPKVIGGFDRVLLDAPCSGTGVISKDPSVKTNKTELDFMQLPHRQKQLLLCAIDSVDHSSKSGGYIVYSTCSVTVEENEQVVQYALRKRSNVRLVETGLVFGRDGFVNHMGKAFDARMKMTKRFYPHAYNVDGFFVSKFQKIGPSPSGQASGGDVVDAHPSDFTVPLEPSAAVEENGEADGDFGGFDEEEDQGYIERARRRRLKRKGIDPRSVGKRTKAANGSR